MVLDYGFVAESMLPGVALEEEPMTIGGVEATSVNTYDAADSRWLTEFTFRRGDEVHRGTSVQHVYTAAEVTRLVAAAGFPDVERYGDRRRVAVPARQPAAPAGGAAPVTSTSSGPERITPPGDTGPSDRDRRPDEGSACDRLRHVPPQRIDPRRGLPVGDLLPEMPADADILAKATGYAVGQTIGTWVEVPGVTDEMRRRHLGRVVKVLEAPPVDLGTQAESTSGYFMQIALPTVNIGPSIPMMLATAIGNDVSTSVQAKLVDIEMPDTLAEELVGPRFGIDGVRDLVGVRDRPLVLNMIKPCTGLTPEQGAAILYETALGGVDLIKDDELMGNPSFSPVVDRVKAVPGRRGAGPGDHRSRRRVHPERHGPGRIGYWTPRDGPWTPAPAP